MTLEELKVVIEAETAKVEAATKSIMDKLDNISRKSDSVSKAITNAFSKAFKAVKRGLQILANSIKSIIGRIGNLFSSITDKIKGAFTFNTANIAKLALAFAGLFRIGQSALEVASDLEEIQNVVNVVFGDSADQINDWARGTLRNFGLVEADAKNLASTFKAMSNSMGIDDSIGRSMSIQLTQLAGDLASFRNTTVAQAQTALSGIYTGETEALKKFGVTMTETNLKAFALSQGITKSYQSMSQAEKVALRYNYVMKATADAQGDFARSSNSWANQIRVLRGQWTQFLGVLGTALKQILVPLLTVVNDILASLVTIAKTVFSLLGVDFSIQAAAASAGVNDLADGLENAATAAGKVNAELAGFDELNRIGDSTGGLAGSIEGSGVVDITSPEINFDEGEDKIEGGLNKLMQKLNTWLTDRFQPFMRDLGGNIANWINNLFSSTDWDLLGTTTANGLNGIILAIDQFWTNLNGTDLGNSIATYFNSVTSTIDWQGLGHSISERFTTTLDIVVQFVKDYDWQALGESIAEAINEIEWNKIGERISAAISEAIIAALDLAYGLLTNSDLGKNVDDFLNGLGSGWDGQGIIDAWDRLYPVIQQKWNELWDSLAENETIKPIIKNISTIADNLADIVEPLGNISAFLAGFTILKSAVNLFADLAAGIASVTSMWSISKIASGEWAAKISADTIKTSGVFHAAFEAIKATLAGGSEAAGATASSFAGAAGVVVAAIAAVIASLVAAYTENETFRKQVDDFYNNTIKPVWDGIVEGIGDIWNHFKPFVDEVITIIGKALKVVWNVLAVVGTVIGEIVLLISDIVFPIAQEVGSVIVDTINFIIDIITGFLKPFEAVLDDINEMLKGLMDFIANVFVGDWEKAFDGLKRFIDGFGKAIVDIFFGIFRGIHNMLDTMLTSGKGIVNTFIGWLNKGISGIFTMINAGIRALNQIKLPDWVPLIGGAGINISYLQAPQIPLLANGGVITSPTLAMLGEYPNAGRDPEIAAPKSLMRETIVEANGEMVGAIYQMATRIISAIDNLDMEVKIGDETIAQSAKRGSDRYKLRTGRPLFA